MSALLQVLEVSRQFGGADRAALDDVSFEVGEGELLTLIGASGSGKTSLLRIIAGLETADSGSVRLGETLLNRGSRILVPPERRQVGFVFQNHALFPHLSVRENVGFGLNRGQDSRHRVAQMLDMVGLSELGDRYPHQLSGGERQRIALARALAPQPRLLLMDEPFSSLDRALRNELRGETQRMLLQAGATTLFVTHDPEDALAISDRIVVLREGRIQQIGTPAEIYLQPDNRYVAGAFGPCNFLPRGAFGRTAEVPEGLGIQPSSVGQSELWLRPEDLDVAPVGRPEALAEGTVLRTTYQGDSCLLALECETQSGRKFELLVRQPANKDRPAGERFSVFAAVR